MAQYGEVRVDFITYTTGVSPEANATITVSSLVNSPTFSGDVVVQGNAEIEGNASISGDLLVSGNSVIEGNNTVSGITITSGMIVQNDATVSGDLTVNGELIATGLVGYVKLNDGGTQQNITGGGGLSINGNVGIGTNDPKAKLEVADTTNSSPGPSIFLRSTGNLAANLASIQKLAGDPNNRPLVFNSSRGTNPGPFVFNSAYDSNTDTNTEVMRIDHLGNMGIGTNDPPDKLSVSNGNIGIVQNSGKIGFNLSDEYSSGLAQYGLTKLTGSTPVNLAGFYGLTFGTNSQQRMTVLQNGNVGIGTNSPNQKLQVETSATTVARLTSTSDSSFLRFASSEGNNLYIGIEDVNEFVVRNKPSSGSLTEKFRITSDGNVGINTSSPLHRLDVAGNLMVRTQSNDGSGTTRQIYFGKSSNPKAALQVINTASNGRCDLAFLLNNQNSATTVDSTDEVMRISRTGNVGIGTDDPQANLEVYGTARIKASDGGPGFEFYPDTVIDASGNRAQRVISFNRTTSSYEPLSIGFETLSLTNGSSSEAVRIDSNGNVGIGTDDPQVKLDVNGDIQGSNIKGTKYTLNKAGDNTQARSGTLDFTFEDILGARILGQRPSGGDETDVFMQIFTGSETGFSNATATFTADGNVAIGKGNATAKLDVNGNIRASDGIDFGDFVAPVTSKTLDDYEEGTWTPNVFGQTTAGTIGTYEVRFGFYTKIGNVVTVGMRVQWSNGTGGAGQLRISGLPYNQITTSTFGIGWIPVLTEVSTQSSNTIPCLFMGSNSPVLQCREFDSSSTAAVGSSIQWAAEGNITTTFSYRTN